MTTSSPSIDIGIFSKRTILTGAGWTRNWDGRLAEELWQDLTGHQAIQASPRLRELLLEEKSFEVALGRVQDQPFTDFDRQVFQEALLDAFISMDREIARPDHHPWINIYKVQELLYRFGGRRGERIDAGYVFTLNQDLWPERRLYGELAFGAPGASLPGLQRRPNQRLFTTDMGNYSDEFIMQPIRDSSGMGSAMSM